MPTTQLSTSSNLGRRHVPAFLRLGAALAILSACNGNQTVSTASLATPIPSSPPETFSDSLNKTSVFIGASIIHRWPLPLHNAGVDSQTSAQVLARFQTDVLGHGYLRVILLCGTNDVIQNTPNLVEEATAHLKAMSQMARAAGMDVVLGELPPATSDGVDLSPTIVHLNAAIAQLAIAEGDRVVDYYTPMYGHPEFFSDGVHPNVAGYAVMEKALSAVVLR